jgi:fatty-acyl-CoA synthase
MLDHPARRIHDLSTLRTGVVTGGPCAPELLRSVVADLHLREIIVAYGKTETGPVVFQCNTDDPLEQRLSTVGRVHPHMEAKVVDEHGRVVPLGTPGELCTRGYGVMRGYFDDPAATARAIDRAGWMHTGDLAVLDAHGYCRIIGRVDEAARYGAASLPSGSAERAGAPRETGRRS